MATIAFPRLSLLAGFSLAVMAIASAQPDAVAQRSAAATKVSQQNPRAIAARNLLKPITVDLTNARLEDVMRFIAEVGNLDLDVMWRDSQFTDGLDKEATVSVSVHNASVLSLLDRVLKKADTDVFSESTWQFGPLGRVQVGPKTRLNRFAYLKTYDINDLVFDIANAVDGPQIDLNNVLNQASSSGGGGGGSGSIFSGNEEVDTTRVSPEERVDAVLDLIRGFIEPDQWDTAGGDGGRIMSFGNSLLIRAPDYIHRQLEGYSFWPDSAPAPR